MSSAATGKLGARLERSTHQPKPATRGRLFAKTIIALVMAPILAACSTSLPLDRSVQAPIAGAPKRITILVATNRTQDPATAALTAGRSPSPSFLRYVISIPPTHQPAQIERSASGQANPMTSFNVVEATALTEASFGRAVVAEAATARGPSTAAIFVHGYNNSFEDSLFRAAQIFNDVDLGGAHILYAWPSEGSLLGYLADKDAADFSRAELARLIEDVAAMRQIDRIALSAHSMGSWLMMEALGRLRISGAKVPFQKLQATILAAPDIDVDVFRAQLETVGRLSPPLTVLVSQDDGALKVSGFLAANHPRVGALDVRDPRIEAAASRYGVRLVDVSSITGLAHDRIGGVAVIYHSLRQELEKRQALGGASALLSNRRLAPILQ